LRGAGLHRDSVTPAYERRLSQTGPWVRVLINTDAIRADDRWKGDHPGAARYLRKLGSSFDIQQVIGEYFTQLDGFRRWFFARVREIESTALAELSAIESEIEALERGNIDDQDSGAGSPGKQPNDAE
jgi:hypothetical protein